jgi:hypothetical protein
MLVVMQAGIRVDIQLTVSSLYRAGEEPTPSSMD